jgi:hypothetical protein
MKHYGSAFEYERERNHDLMKAYKEEIRTCGFISVPEVCARIVEKPSARFWVSEERAAIIISHMMRGGSLDNMRPQKKEMFEEIFRRAMLLKEKLPHLSPYQLAYRVVRQPAPKFYLTPGSAKTIICKIRNKWYEKRKRR